MSLPLFIMDASTNTISPFVYKTYQLVSDAKTRHIVSWNSTGTSLLVWDVEKFEKFILPKYFKHNNFSSFVRQLNTYDFHKVANSQSEALEFQHNYFLRDRPNDLSKIKRKKSGRKDTPNGKVNAPLFGKISIPSPEETAQFSSNQIGNTNSTQAPYTLVTQLQSNECDFSNLNIPVSSCSPPLGSFDLPTTLDTNSILRLCESQLETEQKITSLANQWREAKTKLDGLLSRRVE